MMVRTPPPALLALVFIATVICATSATTVVRESRNTKQTLEEFVADLLAEESKKVRPINSQFHSCDDDDE